MSDQKPRLTYKRNPVGSGVSYDSEEPMRGAKEKARMQFDNVGGNPRIRVYSNIPVPEGQKVVPILQSNLGQRQFALIVGILSTILSKPDHPTVPVAIRHRPFLPSGERGEVEVQSTLYIGRDKAGIIFMAITKEELDDTVRFSMLPTFWADIPNKELSKADISQYECKGFLEYIVPLMAATAVSSYPDETNPGQHAGGGGGGRNYEQKGNSNWKDRQNGGGNSNWKDRQGQGNSNWKDRQGQGNSNWKDRQNNNSPDKKTEWNDRSDSNEQKYGDKYDGNTNSNYSGKTDLPL